MLVAQRRPGAAGEGGDARVPIVRAGDGRENRKELILERMRARQGHFMKENMVNI